MLYCYYSSLLAFFLLQSNGLASQIILVDSTRADYQQLSQLSTFHGYHPSPLQPTAAIFYANSTVALGEGYTAIEFEWNEQGRLFWTLPTQLDPALKSLLPMRNEQRQQEHQLTFESSSSTAPRILAEWHGATLVYLPSESDLLEWTSNPLHAFTELVYISPVPSPFPSLSPSFSSASSSPPTVDKKSVARINRLLENLKYEPRIDQILKALPRGYFGKVVRTLSGEDQVGIKEEDRWTSRNSMSEGGTKAAAWLLGEPEPITSRD